jgi:hypothetical protein
MNGRFLMLTGVGFVLLFVLWIVVFSSIIYVFLQFLTKF